MAFTSGSTAFGVFDDDPAFVVDADRLVRYVSVKLGGGLPNPLPGLMTPDVVHVQVELMSTDVYTCFEEAVVEYGAILNSYQARSAMSSWLGSNTGSLAGGENRYPQSSLEWARRASQAFGEEAYVGGNRPLLSASIDLEPGRQDYDLQALVNHTGSNGIQQRIVVRKVFHFSPFSSYRFFGTTAAMSYLNQQFNFNSFTPESVFYLLPVWEDVLRGMQFELSNKVRRSNYSYEMHGPNNVLKVLPMPQQANRLFFTYSVLDPETHPVDPNDPASGGVSNVGNIPFGNIRYSNINSIGKQWIWKMVLASCKEVLGIIRRKVSQVPIPGAELSLDGDSMVNDARAEMDALRSELRALLEEMTYDKLAAKEAEQAASLTSVLAGVPMLIYMG